MNLTAKEISDLQRDIDHVLDSGANSIRLIDVIERFLAKRKRVRMESQYDKDLKEFTKSAIQGSALKMVTSVSLTKNVAEVAIKLAKETLEQLEELKNKK